MAYRSPLGSNFKLEQSLSACQEEKSQESPRREDFIPFENSSGSRKSYNYDNRRNSRGRNSQYDSSPGWQRGSNNWKSPNQRNSGDEATPVSQFYHPSMLEDPWEELEKNVDLKLDD